MRLSSLCCCCCCSCCSFFTCDSTTETSRDVSSTTEMQRYLHYQGRTCYFSRCRSSGNKATAHKLRRLHVDLPGPPGPPVLCPPTSDPPPPSPQPPCPEAGPRRHPFLSSHQKRCAVCFSNFWVEGPFAPAACPPLASPKGLPPPLSAASTPRPAPGPLQPVPVGTHLGVRGLPPPLCVFSGCVTRGRTADSRPAPGWCRREPHRRATPRTGPTATPASQGGPEVYPASLPS